jgi:hypothetical protein
MEGSCLTGQSPQRAVVPIEEEEEVFNPSQGCGNYTYHLL